MTPKAGTSLFWAFNPPYCGRVDETGMTNFDRGTPESFNPPHGGRVDETPINPRLGAGRNLSTHPTAGGSMKLLMGTLSLAPLAIFQPIPRVE